MDTVVQYLVGEGVLSLREILRLLLLSGLFTALCLHVFPNNAPSRRLFLLLVVSALVFLPWLLASNAVVWTLPMQHPPKLSLSVRLPNFIAVAWVGVALLVCARHFWAMRAEIRGIQRLPIIQNDQLSEMVAKVAEQVGMPTPDVHQGPAACSTTFGAARVVLPSQWKDWDDATLRSVLLHECIHISRKDDRWLLLTRLLVLCYWWMPWLIFLYRHYVRAMEESCDDLASELLGHDISYVGALASAAGVSSAQAGAHVAVANMHRHHLVGRIGRFTTTRALELDTPGIYWWIIGVLGLVVVLTSIQPVQLERMLHIKQSVTTAQIPVGVKTTPDTAIYPEVRQWLHFEPNLSSRQQARLEAPLHSPPVIYPGDALRHGWGAEVVVEFVVNADGSVSNARVVDGSSRPSFQQSALRVVRGTRYASIYTSTYATTELANGHARSNLKSREAPNAFATKSTPLRIAQDYAHIQPIGLRRTFVYHLTYR